MNKRTKTPGTLWVWYPAQLTAFCFRRARPGAAWRHDPKAGFYARDGLHPSTLGSYLTALVIYGRLYGELPASLPKTLQIRSRRVSRIERRPGQSELLLAAAREANQIFGAR